MQDKNPGEEKTIPDSIRIHEALPRILAMISGKGRIELENFSMEIGDLEFWIPTGTTSAPSGSAMTVHQKPSALIQETFFPLEEDFVGRIHEVRLGETASGGGTGEKS